MPRPERRAYYRPGELEGYYARDLFYRGKLTEEVLDRAETLARNGHNRDVLESLHQLRGEWYLARQDFTSAVESFAENVRMSREVGRDDLRSEALLALAQFRAGMKIDAVREAERLSKTITGDGSLAVAELWHSIGAGETAFEHALRAHRWTTADGEPYVHRYYLNRSRALLEELGGMVPKVPRYDSSSAQLYPWENDVRTFIEALQADIKKFQTKVLRAQWEIRMLNSEGHQGRP
jgi:tetratricopeptide (TPR) repeat protein